MLRGISLAQPLLPPGFAVKIIQSRTQDRIEPSVYPLDIAQLILMGQHTDAKFLQHILGIGEVA